ncbi:MAG: hypothetical protein ABEJ70_08960 [Halobacteriaceae archaeon]
MSTSRSPDAGTDAESPGPAALTRTRTRDFSRDTVLDVLSNQRRRFAIHALKRRRGETVPLRALAEQVAAWEYDKPADRLTHKERKRVQNALRQFHLPKMDDLGFVEFDATRGTVRLTDEASSCDFYVDVLPERGIPWGLYYLALSAASVLSLGGVWAHLPLFSAVRPLVWGIFFVTVLGASSLGHFYDNYYRMRVGARETPPEVEREQQ